MKPGLIFKEYIEKDFGYTTTSKLADDISWLAVSSIEEGYFKQDLQKNSKKKWQSALCKIFKKDYTPGLKITLLIINVLGNTKPDPVIAKRLIAQKIIEIYHNRILRNQLKR